MTQPDPTLGLTFLTCGDETDVGGGLRTELSTRAPVQSINQSNESINQIKELGGGLRYLIRQLLS